MVRDLGGPGACRQVFAFRRFEYYEYGSVLWPCNDKMCAAAVVMHTIANVGGRTKARCHLQKLHKIRPSIGSLARMSEVVQQMAFCVPENQNAHVELWAVKETDIQEMMLALHKWLSRHRRCFFVQLLIPGKVDHAVCVNGCQRFVWNSE